MGDEPESNSDETSDKAVSDDGVTQGTNNESANNSNADSNINTVVVQNQPQPDTTTDRSQDNPPDFQDVYGGEGEDDLYDTGLIDGGEIDDGDSAEGMDLDSNLLQQVYGQSSIYSAQDNSTSTNDPSAMDVNQDAQNTDQSQVISGMNQNGSNLPAVAVQDFTGGASQQQAQQMPDNSVMNQQASNFPTVVTVQDSAGVQSQQQQHKSQDNSVINQQSSNVSTVSVQVSAGVGSQQQVPNATNLTGVPQSTPAAVSAAGTSHLAGTITKGNSTDSKSASSSGQAAKKQTTTQKRTPANRRRGREFHDTLLQARAWYGSLDHSDGRVLRKRTIPHDNSSPKKKAKRTGKTPTVPDTKNGDGGAAHDAKNGDGAAHDKNGGGAAHDKNGGGAAHQL